MPDELARDSVMQSKVETPFAMHTRATVLPTSP
jgi:hypothetical protein